MKIILIYHNFGKKGDKYCVKIRRLEEDIFLLMKKGYKFCAFNNLNNTTDDLEVCLTFDDGYASHYVVSKILDKFNIKGTFFVIASKVNHRGYLNEDQIKEMAERGHEIGSHSLTHCNLTKIQQEKLKKELYQSKRILEKILRTKVKTMSIPGGEYNGNVLKETLKYYRKIRTSDLEFVDLINDARIYPALPIIRRICLSHYLSKKRLFLLSFGKKISRVKNIPNVMSRIMLNPPLSGG